MDATQLIMTNPRAKPRKKIKTNINGRRNEGEWKKETYGKMEWCSRHLMGGNHQDKWKAAT